MYLIILVIIAVLLFLIWASADISSGIYIKALCKKETKDKIVALTFDDGPDSIYTEKVLDVLDRHKVKVTFFLIGRNAEIQPEKVKRIDESGHIIAIHTYTHSSFSPFFSSNKYKEEIFKTQEIIENIINKKPLLFRPPFGVTNPTIAKVAKRLSTIGWSIRSLDTLSFLSREKIGHLVIKKAKCGDVILLHDKCKDSDILIDTIITMLKAKGFGFRTIDELFEIEAYDK